MAIPHKKITKRYIKNKYVQNLTYVFPFNHTLDQYTKKQDAEEKSVRSFVTLLWRNHKYEWLNKNKIITFILKTMQITYKDIKILGKELHVPLISPNSSITSEPVKLWHSQLE